jgi:diguanylate cyclase (GGDEF)-like protein
MNIRVLLAESEPEDVVFLRDVLAEIEAGRYWTEWVCIEVLYATTWSAAAAILSNEPIDVLLLDPDLAGCEGMETFRRAQTTAPHVPVILLIGTLDEFMAVRMVREGAQDFLVKRNLDCGPLAHAMRNAMERHRLLSSARAGNTADSLTGLANRSGFTTWADRDRKLAERLERRFMILLAELKNLDGIASTFGEQRRDLALVEAADHLRSMLGPTDLAARVEEGRFAVTIFETEVETLEEAWARMHSGSELHRMRMGAAIFDPARPVSLEILLERAAADLAPAMASQASTS